MRQEPQLALAAKASDCWNTTGMLCLSHLKQQWPVIRLHTLQDNKAAQTNIRGADQAHLTLTILSTVILVQLGTSGCSQLLASWGESSSFASLEMETHPAQPPAMLPGSLHLLADSIQQHFRVSGKDAKRGVVESRVFLQIQLEERI